MKKLLGVLLGLAIVLVVAGFFRGWFSVSKTAEETTTDIHLRIDRQRIKEDVDATRNKVDQLRNGDDNGEGEPGSDALEIPQGTDPSPMPQ